MTKEFNNWWNEDLLSQDNPYVDGTPAFWAWEGWQAALAQPADPTAQAPCVRHCEANAFKIVIRGLKGDIERLKAQLPKEKNT